MKIAFLQTDISWLAPHENMRAAERLMDTCPGCDLYVLPEMWATGFNTSPSYDMIGMAEEGLCWMKRQAALRNAAVAGSLAVKEWSEGVEYESPALWRNRFYFVKPDGEVDFYDKRNLFIYGGEQLTFTPGREVKIVSWRGVRFMLQVCFDLRFPETSRNTLLQPYDVLLYVANWPESRRSAWDALLVARAIENQAYVVGVNRIGTDPQCVYNGGSVAIDAYGRVVQKAEESICITVFTVDVEEIQRFRQKFKVLK